MHALKNAPECNAMHQQTLGADDAWEERLGIAGCFSCLSGLKS